MHRELTHKMVKYSRVMRQMKTVEEEEEEISEAAPLVIEEIFEQMAGTEQMAKEMRIIEEPEEISDEADRGDAAKSPSAEEETAKDVIDLTAEKGQAEAMEIEGPSSSAG